MKVSHNWLKKYIDFDLTPDDLAAKLTMLGLEVEGIEHLGKKYKGFVVGEVLECNRHPNADKLSVCRVDVGTEQLQIICGAPNIATGQKVPVGLVGATVPHDQHDPQGKAFVLTKVRIRGVESSGMICSEYELGLGSDKEGIMVLDSNAQIGMSLDEYLGLNDVVYEVSITPNRPDCLSHIGIAREVGVIVGKSICKPEMSLRESAEQVSKHASVEILDAENCLRYTARVIRNVRIKPSPQWMQNALKAVGLRPINNVVDITNYVLMETGHPLHAFDYDKLAGHRIIVRCAQEGELFITLDGKKHTLRSDTLLICDAERGVAIAGVMGGLDTEITDTTRNVLLESAYFNPRSIRRTSKYLGLSTDSAYRFERGADVNGTIYALNRAAQLMEELADGEVLQGIIDVYPKKIEERKVSLRTSRVNSVLGTTFDKDEIIKMLSLLEIKLVHEEKDLLDFLIPTFRPDLEREIDLIEEIARVYGYNNIEDKMKTTITMATTAHARDFRDEIRERFVGSGFTEVVTNSMQDKQTATLFSDKVVEVLNPISKDMTCLRASLIPGILGVIRYNKHHGSENLKIFEIGNVFSISTDPQKKKLVDNVLEEERLIFGMTGTADPQSWDIEERQFDFYDLKGEVEAFFSKISLDNYKFIYYDTGETLNDYHLGIEINGTYVGSLQRVNSDILQEFDIEGDVFLCELNLGILVEKIRKERRYEVLPRFPSVRRDLAFVVDYHIRIGEIEEEIRKSSSELLRQIRLFDIYVGDQISAGKKSIAFSLEFMSREKTLTEKEVDEVVQRIVANIGNKYHAVLRS